MADTYRNRYRVPSARAAWWDYGCNGLYFVTICTRDRVHYFGEVSGGEMVLSAIGAAAQSCWQEIPQHFPFVRLDAFVVMPNHVHGIVMIDKGEAGRVGNGNRFGPQSQNLASVVRGYKVGVTKFARSHDLDFAWQPRFHDRIIRDAEAYAAIARYIANNPSKWREDTFYGPKSR